jgi:hypothetical protein
MLYSKLIKDNREYLDRVRWSSSEDDKTSNINNLNKEDKNGSIKKCPSKVGKSSST